MTITEIAKLAGVGTYSVSRYFNTPHLVSSRMKEKIRKVVEANHFELNPNRTGPKTGNRAGIKHRRAALLTINDMSPSMLRQLQVPNTVFDGLQNNLQANGISLDFYGAADGSAVPEEISADRYDGLILYGNPHAPWPKLPEQFAGLGIVQCFGGSRPRSCWEVDYVDYDNRQVGIEAANYLYCRGHRRAVVFNPMFGMHPVYQARCEAFAERAAELGMKSVTLNAFSPGAIVPGGCKNHDITYSLATQFHQERFANWTGCFFCSDPFMLGTCLELARLGADIDRLDLIGCDNTDDFLSFFKDRPASIDIRLEEIAELTVQRLMARIAVRMRKTKAPALENLILPPLLVPKQLEEDEEDEPNA